MERKTRFPRVFVTVGTTRFDALVEAVVSEPSLAALEEMGAREVVVQHGNSPWSSDAGSKSSALRVSGYNFKSDIASDMLAADLVVSHAGGRR